MLERELGHAAGLAVQTVYATAQHLHRMVGFVGTAVGQTAREVSALLSDYQDLAGELRRSDEKASRAGHEFGGGGTQAAQVLHLNPRRRAMQRNPARSTRRAIGTRP